MKTNVLALQKLTSSSDSQGGGSGPNPENNSMLSVSGCGGKSGFSLLLCL